MKNTPLTEQPDEFSLKMQEIQETKKYLENLLPSKDFKPRDSYQFSFQGSQVSKPEPSNQKNDPSFLTRFDAKNPIYQYLKAENKLYLLERLEEEEKSKENKENQNNEKVLRENFQMIKEITEQNDFLQKETLNLKKKLLEQDLRYKQTIKELHQDSVALVQKKDDMKKKDRELLENEIGSLHSQLKIAEARVKDSKEEVQTLKKEKKMEIKELDEQICNLRIEGEKFKEKEKFYEGMHEKMLGLEKTIEKLKEMIDLLNEKWTNKYNLLLKDLSEKTTLKIDAWTKEKMKSFEGVFTGLEKKISQQCEMELKRVKENYEVKKELEAEIQGFIGAIDTLKVESDNKISKMKKEHKTDVAEVEDLLTEKTIKYDELMEMKKELEKNHDILEKENEILKTNVSDLEKENKEKQIENEKAKDLLSQLKENYENLQKVMEKITKENQELQKKQNEQIENFLKEKEEQNQLFKEKLKIEQEEEIKKIETDISKTIREINKTCDNKVNELLEKNQALLQEYETLKKVFQDKDQENEENKKAVQKFSFEIEEKNKLENQNETKESPSNKSKDNEDSEKKLQSTLIELKRVKEENENLQMHKSNESEETEKKIQLNINELAQIKEENANLKKQIENLNQEHKDEILKQHLASQVQMASLMDQINGLTNALNNEKSMRSSQKVSFEESKKIESPHSDRKSLTNDKKDESSFSKMAAKQGETPVVKPTETNPIVPNIENKNKEVPAEKKSPNKENSSETQEKNSPQKDNNKK